MKTYHAQIKQLTLEGAFRWVPELGLPIEAESTDIAFLEAAKALASGDLCCIRLTWVHKKGHKEFKIANLDRRWKRL